MSGLAGERKTPKGEGKHYIPFTHAEWAELAKAFGRTPDDLRPQQIKNLLLALQKGKVGLTPLTDPAPAPTPEPAPAT